MVRFAISGALSVGLALAGALAQRQEPSITSGTTAEQTTRPAVEQASIEPGGQVQVEAAILKREAVTVARQVAEAYPEDALAYALLGSAFYNIGKSEAATKYLRRCLELSPGQADAYDILSRVAYEKGNLEESAQLCQEALKRGPPTSELLNRLGRTFMDLGQTDEAIRTLQQAVQLPRPTSESYYLLGQANLQSGNYARAKDHFLRAIQLLPDHTQAFFGAYTACMRLGQLEDAEKYRAQFQKFEAIDRQTLTDRSAQEDTLTGLPLVRKTVARTFFGAAQIYRLHKQPGKAAELFLKSAVLDAGHPGYRAALEAHYVQSNAPAEGVAVFEQLAAKQPESTLNHLFLGRLHGRLDHFEAAERAFRKVQVLAPEWSEGYRALAELYLRSDRKPAEARKLARRVVELESTGPHFYLLALACLKNKDRTAALEAMKRAVALSPTEKKYQGLLQQLTQPP